jgi:uncharacterized lipoprotein YddW (UPF0748 family)
MAFFITPFHQDVRALSRLVDQEEKSFHVLVQLTAQMGDEKRPPPSPPFGSGLPAFFIALHDSIAFARMRLLPAVLLAAAPALAADASPRGEMRGVWVVRTGLVSPESVDRVVDEAQAGGFNALFVQVRGRGDALYESALVSRSVLLEQQPAAFDPFGRLLQRARARGLQVHAWINVLLTAHFGQPLPAGHILQQHPEWVMVPRSVSAAALSASGPGLLSLALRGARAEGEAEGYYLSPSVPGVADHLAKVVSELVGRYAVDGLHLDFIRYPGPEYDYSRAALERFRRTRGGGDLLGGPAQQPAAWDQYRRDVLSALAGRLVAVARKTRPGMLISAAIVPDEAQAIYHRYQSWPAWMADGLLDAVAPMTYTPDTRIFRQQVEQVRSRARPGQPVWAGIGAYRLPLASIVEKIQAARASGASGVLLFSHESLSPADLKRLRDAAFTTAVAAARASSGEVAGPR